MQFSTAIVDFNLFYDGSVDMQIRALLTRGPLGVSSWYSGDRQGLWTCCLFWIYAYFDSMVTDPPKKPRVSTSLRKPS